MTYATLLMLNDRYGERMLIELTDRSDPPAGAVDSDVVDRALADTDAVIDGYVSGRYQMPLAETPPLLQDIAQRIAIYNCHRYTPNDKIKEDYKDALAALEKISKGVIRLPVAGVEPTSSGASGVQTTDRERPFTEANLTGFI
ncbi:MAG: DUF1320 domain-containing protein [Sphingomonadaceae bacterium]|nr:DUF1320 domain-containing protein [Sphingomonadaceae bacterium]